MRKLAKLVTISLIFSLMSVPVFADSVDETIPAESESPAYATGIDIVTNNAVFTGANNPKKVLLGPEVVPATATDQTFTCSSANEDVAVVSNQGAITPTGFGKTIITVTSGDGKANAECAVSVYITDFAFADADGNEITTLSLKKGDTYTVSVLPADNLKANDILNSMVFDVEGQAGSLEKAVFTATKSGSATITATLVGSKNNGTEIEKALTVKVINPVTEIKTDKDAYDCLAGSSVQIKAVVNDDADNKTLSYKSDNKDFEVDEKGLVTLSKSAKGDATITISAADEGGFSKTVKVTAVKKPVEKIECDTQALVLIPGDTAKISAKVVPADATVQTVTFVSPSKDVTVDKDGNVKVSQNAQDQSVKITAVADEKTYEVVVFVKTDTTGAIQSIEAGKDFIYTLKASVDPKKAKIRVLDDTIAKVSEMKDNGDGTLSLSITGLKEGQTAVVITQADVKTPFYHYINVKVTKSAEVSKKDTTEQTETPVQTVTKTPAKVASPKVSAKKGKFKVSFKKTDGALKYEIQYAKKKTFKSAKKKTVSKTSASIKAKKGTWYVRIRAVSAEGKAGKWSKKFKIKVK